jgi:hypothetical protein
MYHENNNIKAIESTFALKKKFVQEREIRGVKALIFGALGIE